MAADPCAPLRARFAEKHPLVAAALYGDTQRALQLVQQDPVAAAAAAFRGVTMLVAAVLADAGEVVAALCSSAPVDIVIPRDLPWQTLSMASGTFIDVGALIMLMSEPRHCPTVFSLAIRLGHSREFKALLPVVAAAPSSSIGTGMDHPFLRLVCCPLSTEQKLDAVRQMLEHGLDPLDLKGWSYSPLVIITGPGSRIFEHQAGQLMLEALLHRDQQQAQQAQQGQQARQARQQPHRQLAPSAARSTHCSSVNGLDAASSNRRLLVGP